MENTFVCELAQQNIKDGLKWFIGFNDCQVTYYLGTIAKEIETAQEWREFQKITEEVKEYISNIKSAYYGFNNEVFNQWNNCTMEINGIYNSTLNKVLGVEA